MPTVEARLERAMKQIAFLRWVIIVLSAVLVLAALTPIAVIVFNQQTTEQATVTITCAGYQNQIAQLKALRALERRLGVPVDFTIPEVPVECTG